MGKVVFIACTNVGRAMIEAIYNSEFLKNVELAGVVNMSPTAAIGKANYDSYIDLKEKYGFDLYYCNNVNDDECISFIEKCEPDIIIQSGWSQKFSDKVLNIPRYACIGEHPAPLPKGRGAACINWAIITGEREWGDSFFGMEMTYDTGLIYSQEMFNIEMYDNVKTVYDKVAQVAVKAIEKNLENWTEGILNGKSQDDALATHYKRRQPSDGEFDFNQNSIDIYNQIRGQTRPYPGAYFVKMINCQAKKVYVWDASLQDIFPDASLEIICGDGKAIYLNRIQIEGNTEMWATDAKNILLVV